MQEISHWIRLTSTPGIGCGAARKLLLAFGLPEQIFAVGFHQLRTVLSERQAKALCAPPDPTTLNLIERTLLWCSTAHNHIVTLADSRYPASLLEIPDPPALLYVKGQVALLKAKSIAIVGSRNATRQGILNASQFASSLSQSGLTITSGLASGVDAAAHQGGLTGSGSTIAVIGTGADIIYPARHRDLAHQIAENGCIVSEYPLGTPAISSNFPRRNRLISGLSCGVLVIEAAAQSGSLITAQSAAEQGREVFAIPGSIHSPLSKGCHSLIKQGAKLVENVQDILQELRLDNINYPVNATIAPETARHPLLQEIGYDPIHPDALEQRCQLSSSELHEQLLLLEMEGCVEIVAGGLYRRLNIAQ